MGKNLWLVLLLSTVLSAQSLFAENKARCDLALKSKDLSSLLQPGLVFRKKKNLYVVLRSERFSTSGDGFMDNRQIEVVRISEQSPGPHSLKNTESYSIFDRNFFANAELVTEAAVKWGVHSRRQKSQAVYNRDLRRGDVFRIQKRNFVVNVSRPDTLEAFEMIYDGELDQEPHIFKLRGEVYPDGVEAFEHLGEAELTLQLDFY